MARPLTLAAEYVSLRLSGGLTLIAGLMSLLIGPSLVRSDEPEIFFEAKVRPLLQQHCVECHGPTEQAGQLRLDRNPIGQNAKIVIPHQAQESKLMQAVGYRDSKLAMPPDGKLDDQQIETLNQWINSGAYWPTSELADESERTMLPPAQRIDEIRQEHWSFRPIEAFVPPEVDDQGRSQQPIDKFIFASLRERGLSVSSMADKRTLMMRAYFVLVGLPPSYEQVQSFMQDNSPDAFSRLVDQLLENPHYGERWARHWLDIARYAETTGYLPGSVDTTYPYAYTYRDYVINAFNEDKPYDQFVIEQIAADRLDLPQQDQSSLAALGFLTVGRSFMNRVHDIIDDRIDVVTRGFLGLTVTCARCHDHKYDPISAADYYALYGIFASSSAPDELPLLGNPADNPQYQQFLDDRAEKEREVEAWLEKKRVQTENELRSRVADYLVFFAKTRPKSGYDDVKPIGDRGALRPQAVDRWRNFLKDQAQIGHPLWSLWHRLAEIPAENFQARVQELLGDESSTALAAVHPELLRQLKEHPPESMEAWAKWVGEQLEAAEAAWRTAKKEDSSVTQLDDPHQEAWRIVLYETSMPTLLNLDQMRNHLNQAERNEYNQQLSKVKAVESKHPGAPGRAMVLQDKPKPHNPVIFLRGQPGNHGDKVPRRFLEVLSHVDGGKHYGDSGRLDLAQAIASPNNPLTARVIVNRIWQHHFGYGLVRTASDFGIRGQPPTHPELLDYLAAEFMADGWSIKRLQRRLMLSAAWQQVSDHRAEGSALDPENRLLWRMPRRRLEFEPLRDRWLTASGQLDLAIGGRSVRIHEDATRRGLYAYMDREDVPGLLAAFDLPSPDASQAMRSQTTVPQQALYMINSKFVIQQAQTLAEATANSSDEELRIADLYRRALSRDPTASELEMAKQFIQPTSGMGTQVSADLTKRAATDLSALAESDSAAALDTWIQLAQVLLASNEFAFVD